MSDSYCKGPQFMSIENIKKSDFMEMFDAIEEKYKGMNLDFKLILDFIPDSGIILRLNDAFKKIKIFLIDKDGHHIQDIYCDPDKDIWRGNSEILIPKHKRIGTLIESSEEKWTRTDLNIFLESIEEIGCKLTKVPSKKELRLTDDPEYYIGLFY